MRPLSSDLREFIHLLNTDSLKYVIVDAMDARIPWAATLHQRSRYLCCQRRNQVSEASRLVPSPFSAVAKPHGFPGKISLAWHFQTCNTISKF